jgi:hypothetical protein
MRQGQPFLFSFDDERQIGCDGLCFKFIGPSGNGKHYDTVSNRGYLNLFEALLPIRAEDRNFSHADFS